jgi:hypothetical protein
MLKFAIGAAVLLLTVKAVGPLSARELDLLKSIAAGLVPTPAPAPAPAPVEALDAEREMHALLARARSYAQANAAREADQRYQYPLSKFTTSVEHDVESYRDYRTTGDQDGEVHNTLVHRVRSCYRRLISRLHGVDCREQFRW